MPQYADGRVLSETDGGVARIIFNNPEKRNAMSVAMWRGLAQALDDRAADPSVRVVVLSGAGPHAFVSGADISEFEARRADASAQVEYDRLTSAGRARLAAFGLPVIAAVRGFCLGGGVGIAVQADLRIAAEGATFGIPAARLGVGYGFDMVRALVALVGPAHARMLLYSGERIGAAEAARIGLVNRVVPDDALDDAVLGLARAIAGNAPLSVRAAKLAVAAAVQDPAERDRAGVDAAIAACFDSADYREGRAAFRERRPPRFTGG